ncbi:glycosyltransferase family 4 protein [Sediminicola luteus]|uniref:Glycosyltransferase family 4 protein n=1 Tax=Sediminicola luteus TaxID=319238 RepID=A0ABV2TYA8_9FLAO
MKIAFVIYGLGSGGAERSVTGLANYFVNQHQVSIITLVKTTPFFELDPKVRLHYCLEQPKERTNPIQSITNGMVRIHRLVKLLKTEEAEVAISFMHTSNIYTIWAAKWLNLACVISERANHDVASLPKIQELLRNFSYPYSSRLIVQTEGNRKYYQKIIPSNQIEIIPNAVSFDLKSKRQLLKNFSEKTILNVGAFRKGKAQDVLIRAFAKLSNTSWRLVFIGSGTDIDLYKALAVELGVSERIEFKGEQKDVSYYYNKASMFVFTSEHEGFPNALLEALYFGIPSISTDCPHGPADLITDGVNGFLIHVGDHEALVRKIDTLIEDQELQKSFSKKAIEQSSQYEIENIAKKWMVVIKSVLPS